MEISFRHMKVKLNIFQASQCSSPDEECYTVDVIEELIEEALPTILSNDPLEACLTQFGYDMFDIDESIEEVNSLLNSTLSESILPWKARYESLPTLSKTPALPSIENPPKLELKTLPTPLKYVFLGSKILFQ
jgi:hypothetical protein